MIDWHSMTGEVVVSIVHFRYITKIPIRKFNLCPRTRSSAHSVNPRTRGAHSQTHTTVAHVDSSERYLKPGKPGKWHNTKQKEHNHFASNMRLGKTARLLGYFPAAACHKFNWETVPNNFGEEKMSMKGGYIVPQSPRPDERLRLIKTVVVILLCVQNSMYSLLRRYSQVIVITCRASLWCTSVHAGVYVEEWHRICVHACMRACAQNCGCAHA